MCAVENQNHLYYHSVQTYFKDRMSRADDNPDRLSHYHNVDEKFEVEKLT